jgi:hypothetical protein
MNDNGQMMVWEAIFFAATVLLALIFLYQLSPTSTISRTSTYDLKVQGNSALYSLANDVILEDRPLGYPSNKLAHYLITNAYENMISDINDFLPSNTMYNIYVSNGTTTVFWCNSQGSWSAPLPHVDPVTTSHCLVAMTLTAFSESANRAGFYSDLNVPRDEDFPTRSDLISLFGDQDYDGPLFEVILEMWST